MCDLYDDDDDDGDADENADAMSNIGHGYFYWISESTCLQCVVKARCDSDTQ